jgi:hypothetical protein
LHQRRRRNSSCAATIQCAREHVLLRGRAPALLRGNIVHVYNLLTYTLVPQSNLKVNVDFAQTPYCFRLYKNVLTQTVYFSKIYHIAVRDYIKGTSATSTSYIRMSSMLLFPMLGN